MLDFIKGTIITARIKFNNWLNSSSNFEDFNGTFSIESSSLTSSLNKGKPESKSVKIKMTDRYLEIKDETNTKVDNYNLGHDFNKKIDYFISRYMFIRWDGAIVDEKKFYYDFDYIDLPMRERSVEIFQATPTQIIRTRRINYLFKGPFGGYYGGQKKVKVYKRVKKTEAKIAEPKIEASKVQQAESNVEKI